MNEQLDSTPEHATGGQQTGNHAVDRVLESLDALQDRPVEEHVPVFENAHDQLRKALDSAHESMPGMPRPSA